MDALEITAPSPDSSTSRVVQLPTPAPGPTEVAIDVAHAGLNFMDVMGRRGDAGYAPDGWPFRPGLEVSGTVRAVGREVTDLTIGTRVAALVVGGGLAEVAVAERQLVVEVPDEVDLATAAGAPMMISTAVLLLHHAARLRVGERVFMRAASGGVGSVVPQVARSLGAAVAVGSVSSSAKVAAARTAGWGHALTHDEDPLADHPTGFDVILDPTGTGALADDLRIAAPGARIVLFGNAIGGQSEQLPSFGQLLGGNVGIMGFSITALRRTRPERVADAMRSGLDMVARGELTLPLTIVDSLDGVPAAHDLLAGRRGVGKYVVSLAG